MSKYERLARELCRVLHVAGEDRESVDHLACALQDFCTNPPLSELAELDAKNAGSDITAKLLLEIAESGEKHGVFGGELQEKTANAILKLKAERDELLAAILDLSNAETETQQDAYIDALNRLRENIISSRCGHENQLRQDS